MNIRVYASSMLGVWAALRLRAKGHPVKLLLLKQENEPLRPVRIPRSSLSPIISQLTRLGIPVAHLLESPTVRGWVSPAGESFDRVWSDKGVHEERWIDPGKLKVALLRACELEGVDTAEVELFPVPDWSNFDYLGVYESDRRAINHWSKAFQRLVHQTDYDMTEILFPRGMESALQKIMFFEFEGVKGILENLNRQKSVLTLVSRSRVLIDRKIEDLRTRLSERESGGLRALFALNPHVFRRDYVSTVGESGLYLPQFCLIGSALGGLPVLMHTGVREGIKQIERLEEELDRASHSAKSIDPVRIAENWYQREKKGFLRLLSWQGAWESSLWSRMRQTWALRVHQFMPGKFRDLLRSPL